MRRIGLLGGMSFEASAAYYQLINQHVRHSLGGLNSADIILRSLNFKTITDLQQAGAWEEAGRLLADAAHGLEQAGADCVLICAVTMHRVAETVQSAIDIPLINIVDATASRLMRAERKRPLLLATRYTIDGGFFHRRMAQSGIDILAPDGDACDVVHDIIFEELCKGQVSESSRIAMHDIIETAHNAGADSVIFGCTEIGLLLDPTQLSLPAFDATAIHVQTAVDFALSPNKPMIG